MKTEKNDKMKPDAGKSELPVHSLNVDERIIQVRPLEHHNPYDWTREHRHTYFEVMFVDVGGGNQLIDFVNHPALDNSCYIIFPQQIHLMNRKNSTGTVVQFTEEVIPSVQLRNTLRQLLFGENSAVVFENNAEKMARLNSLIDLLRDASEKSTKVSQEMSIHLLQALLCSLIENKDAAAPSAVSDDQKLLFQFQQLLEEQYAFNKSVQEYVALTKTTEKKLAAVTKKYTGLSPLQVILNRVLLEAKRILLFEDTSHKEIAFRLGFDSPASFSQFIKNKTGYTPSELSAHLVEIHK